MITKDRISAWLEEPHHLQEVAPKALLQFAKEYPYFTPAHYLLYIGGRQSPETLFLLQQTNPVHPVMLHNLITASEELPVIAASETILIETVNDNTAGPKGIAEETTFMLSVSSDDYFLKQGIHVSNELPEPEEVKQKIQEQQQTDEEKEKALMVVMSFSEWLKHISLQSKKAKEEEADQKALKTMWQQQKLAAVIEEENEEIPEQVFEMAVNSISRNDELISESLAEVYARQGKKGKAIDMYQKLSLLNPEKNTYFAAKIQNLQKDL